MLIARVTSHRSLVTLGRNGRRRNGAASCPTELRRHARVLLALLLGGAGGACAGSDGPAAPAGGGGVGERFSIEPAGPVPLVGLPGSDLPGLVSVIVRPLTGSAAAAEGERVLFRVIAGNGRLLADETLVQADGSAAVGFRQPARADSTLLRVELESDPAAFLDLAVLARPGFTPQAEPGGVLAVPQASHGVVLRFPPGESYDLVPYTTAASRPLLRYFLLRDGRIRLDERSTLLSVPALEPSQPPVAAGVSPAPAVALAGSPARPVAVIDAGAGAVGVPRLQSLGSLPPAVDIFNCAVELHRSAPLVRIGQRIALYVDAIEPPDSSRLAAITEAFDRAIEPRVIQLFGPPLDLDNNGRVLAVLTRSMPGDGGVYCNSVHESAREVIYATWNPELPVEQHLRLLAHELQHVINASQRVRYSPILAARDVVWLDEGFSQVAEWMAGYPAADLTRTFSFLNQVNGSLSLLGQSYDPAYIGGWFLFALYLGDRFGEGIYLSLTRSPLSGAAKVERVTGIAFRDILRDWFVALATSASGVEAPAAWRYRSIDLAGEQERAQACSCLPNGQLPGVAVEALPDIDEFTLARSLNAHDADFWRVPAGEEPLSLYFVARGDPDVELFLVRRR